jgi:hypothetical protein
MHQCRTTVLNRSAVWIPFNQGPSNKDRLRAREDNRAESNQVVRAGAIEDNRSTLGMSCAGSGRSSTASMLVADSLSAPKSAWSMRYSEIHHNRHIRFFPQDLTST